MKRERIVRTENIDRQRIKYRVLFGFIFIMCCNGAALPSEGRQDAGLEIFF